MNYNWSNAGSLLFADLLGSAFLIAAPHSLIVKTAELEAKRTGPLSIVADKAVLTITDDLKNSQTYHVVDVRFDEDGEYEFLAINSHFMPTPLPEVPYANLVRKAIGGDTLKADFTALMPMVKQSTFAGCSEQTMKKGEVLAEMITRPILARQSEAEKILERIRDVATSGKWTFGTPDELTPAERIEGIVAVLREDAGIKIDKMETKQNRKLFYEREALFEANEKLREELANVRADNDALKSALGTVEAEELSIADASVGTLDMEAAHAFLNDVVALGDTVTIFYQDIDPLVFERIVEVEIDEKEHSLTLTDAYDRVIFVRSGFLYFIAES